MHIYLLEQEQKECASIFTVIIGHALQKNSSNTFEPPKRGQPLYKGRNS